jgi:hypothetical protein
MFSIMSKESKLRGGELYKYQYVEEESFGKV